MSATKRKGRPTKAEIAAMPSDEWIEYLRKKRERETAVQWKHIDALRDLGIACGPFNNRVTISPTEMAKVIARLRELRKLKEEPTP